MTGGQNTDARSSVPTAVVERVTAPARANSPDTRAAAGPRVAEFFAGIGLVRMGLERAGFEVVWANDNSPTKKQMYASQFGAEHFVLKDVRQVGGADLPDIDLATASFPCIDLSLAGNRGGLREGSHSSTFWEFVRILSEQGERRPRAIMVENVTGFLNSHKGEDLRIAIAALNDLGYICDILTLDAKHFVPQSRPRLFIVGLRQRVAERGPAIPSPVRSEQVVAFVAAHPSLDLQAAPLPAPPDATHTLAEVVERLPADDARWWFPETRAAFERQLGPLHAQRLRALVKRPTVSWATAYRRTCKDGPAWEIRDDALGGCLRAVSGGSSRQAVVEAGAGSWRVRWLTGREYARLQGAPDFNVGTATENQVLHAFGDAVCVPAVAWLAAHYLRPLLTGEVARPAEEALLAPA